MEDLRYHSEDCICALATPWGKGAIGVIRLSGNDCLRSLAPLFSAPKKLLSAPGNTIVYGQITDPSSGGVIDEVMIGVYRAPKSYTGQEAAEIMCHGSLPGIRSLLDLLRRHGFRDAGPGEFTMRAFLNGKMDLTKAEAVNELIGAKTRASHLLALRRLKGSVYTSIEALKQDLVSISAQVELQLDYPEDEIDFDTAFSQDTVDRIFKGLKELLSTYNTGKLYKDGIRVALAGPTNAGKSSLFNLFVKEDRALVSETHGTTRDYLTELLTLKGIPVTLVDTAGLRTAEDTIESRGIERSKELISASDIVLFVWDSTIDLDHTALEAVESHAGAVIGIWNKSDLKGKPCPEGFIPASAVTGRGFEDIEDRIIDQIHADTGIMDSAAVIDSDRQKLLLEQTRESMERFVHGIDSGYPLDAAAVDLQDALQALGEITGEVSSSDILEKMFSSFCVGK